MPEKGHNHKDSDDNYCATKTKLEKLECSNVWYPELELLSSFFFKRHSSLKSQIGPQTRSKFPQRYLIPRSTDRMFKCTSQIHWAAVCTSTSMTLRHDRSSSMVAVQKYNVH